MFVNFWKHGSPALTKTITTSMPTAVYLISYAITTLLAATIYLLPGGAEYITNRGTALAGKAFEMIGSPTYLALLYLPVVIVPLAAWLTVKLLKRPAKVLNKVAAAELQILTPVLWVIALISIVYCTMTLHAAGALDTGLLSGGDYISKTTRRLNLLENLGFTFFAFAYGINLIIPILAFIAYVMQGGKISDLILFIVSFVFFLFTITATYSKAQILIYLIMMGAAFVLTRAKIKYVAIVSAVSVSAFILTGYAMTAPPAAQDTETTQETATAATETTEIKITTKPAIPSITPAASETTNHAKGTHPKDSHAKDAHSKDTAAKNSVSATTTAPTITAPVPVPQLEASVEVSEPKPETTLVKLDGGLIMSYIKRLSGDALHRMAAAMPFYVAMFEDESERCGIQGNLVRKVFGMPEPQCVLPIKVFNAMYPEVDWAQGQQPAPATLSAYGEIGLPWAICVMILCGVFLGILGTIGSASASPLFIGFTVAACSFAYYLTQVSIVASFTYPHGIFAFMIPIAALLVAALKKPRARIQSAVA
ncbi:hypothetical protein [Pseudomonas sp. zfem002]|uniref:hypothetical protein n=1 Tax=Pseudomonas sp. zfem002 TaxID=3078197 RepID=UPI002928C872|nr:hypothetical protein [Pseudomonas sp. zfem002]MDU9390880.1 hypothetical protein [Pseudomonas sp. zfem002]